jgi:starch-binding outer membrane protein, SusD/RagB family
VLLYAASKLNNPTNDLTKWKAAADAADSLINTRYTLHNNYQELFLQHTDEIIFARYHTQASELKLSLNVGRNNDDGWGSDSPTQNLVDDFEMTNGEMPYLEDGSINPASGYDDQNPYTNRDPRFYASILYDGSMWMDREWG